MPKLEKTFERDIEELNKKIGLGVCAICSGTRKRGTWDTTLDGVRCMVTLFEKFASKVYAGEDREMPDYPETVYRAYSTDDYKDQAHVSMTVTLVGNDKEVRLFAITAGTGHETYFYPYPGGEGELMGALNITLDILDDIIL